MYRIKDEKQMKLSMKNIFNKRKSTDHSIAVNLTLSLFLLVIVVEGILFAVIYAGQERHMTREVENTADEYADYLKEILVVPMWDYDDEQIEKIGAGIAKNKLVHELIIQNSLNETLYQYRSFIDAESIIKRSIQISRKGKHIGKAKLYFTLDIHQNNLIWIRNLMISILLTSVIFILIATTLLLRFFLRNPIRVLQRGLDRVSSGDYNYEFEDVHYKELSGIAKRIKEMALIIQKREHTLREINAQLVKEVDKRKKEATEKIHLEKKLQHANKMKAIGTLAGGVAHDLNNILTSIVAYPDLILMQLPKDSDLLKPVKAIKESGLKAGAIVQDLLTLARRGVAITEIVDLNSIITEYLQSPEFYKLTTYHPNTAVKTKLDDGLLRIKGSSVHLSKTIMNLVSNAAEAMPDGGDIRISTTNRHVNEPLTGYKDIQEGEYVVLAVSDSGVGISVDEKDRIFEPFYTKKKMGKSGTGLGMAVVWGTVQDHSGYIDIESIVGEGTTFTIYIPATSEKVAAENHKFLIDTYRGNGETILVVDDLESQRDIATDILTKLGYLVFSVSSGPEAVEFLEKQEVDLVIIDMLMEPGIDGLETYQRILSLYPKQKAIIASGYSETHRVRESLRLGAGAYIRKPYTLETIGVVVRNEIDRHGSGK